MRLAAVPFMGLLYLVSFIDRTNAAFAALTMNRDLGFSPSVFGFGAGVFFSVTRCSSFPRT
jgi:ACS family tartrate transporter-like MFS transporter